MHIVRQLEVEEDHSGGIVWDDEGDFYCFAEETTDIFSSFMSLFWTPEKTPAYDDLNDAIKVTPDPITENPVDQPTWPTQDPTPNSTPKVVIVPVGPPEPVENLSEKAIDPDCSRSSLSEESTPEPTYTAPEPTYTAPEPTYTAPEPTPSYSSPSHDSGSSYSSPSYDSGSSSCDSGSSSCDSGGGGGGGGGGD